MSMYTTNYIDTFIAVSEDCPAEAGEVPPIRAGKQSIANIQLDMIDKRPYQYTSDDVIFACFAEKQGLKRTELKEEREKFFSKGQACLRSSPLVKRYGWGVHSDSSGKVAIYGRETKEYTNFQKDNSLNQTKGMRSKRG